MRQLFKIDESEKKRILEMHENATKKNYLGEQTTQPTSTTAPQQREPFASENGVKYKLPAITSDDILSKFISVASEGASASKLQRWGLKGITEDGKKDESGKSNFTANVYSLIGDYMNAIGQSYGKNELVCQKIAIPPEVKTIAENIFMKSKGWSARDMVDLYRTVGGDKNFLSSVSKAAKEQIDKIGGCQS